VRQKPQWRSAEKTRLLLFAMRELAGDALVSFEGRNHFAPYSSRTD
jgi:hypothetical protein